MATACGYAIKACEFRGEPGPLTRIQRRRVPGGSWEDAGTTCYPNRPPAAGVAAPPPPAVPTFGQIQQAYRELPFASPRVRIQPEGTTTLVNLPTYYRVEWPQAGLAPGDISDPVQLLSWRVEFKVATQDYRYFYGDGSASARTTSPGGRHPDGDVVHTFTRPVASAPVKVDARLTGQFRVNGGAWQDIETVADLQGEPVTTIQVREATNRLVTPPS